MIPTSYSGQADAVLNTHRRWVPGVEGAEEIRADVVRAIRLNARIERLDRNGMLGWPTAVVSDPVILPPWSA